MVRRALCNRAHSAVTQKVNAIEEGKVNGHAAFLKFASGQLLFLGLNITPKFNAPREFVLQPSTGREGRTGNARRSGTCAANR